MKTQEFRTRTLLKKREHLQLDGKWIVAEDIGYSGVKIFSPNGYACFPAYASKLKTSYIAEPTDDFICYRNDVTGEEWIVGAVAQNMISIEDTNDSEDSLFGRNRYFDPMFKVIASVGIAIGLSSNSCGSPEGKEVFLQTGLPPAYIKSDSELLMEALCGEYHFSIRIGKTSYKKFDFVLDSDHILIMPQPKGTLTSICTDNNGHLVANARKFLSKRTLIFDPGFGTLDVYPCIAGKLGEPQTFDNLGMKEVFKRTCEKIYEKYSVEVRIATMQKNLDSGYVVKVDKRKMPIKKTKIHFTDILEESNKEVCMEAIEQLMKLYNYFSEIDYLVVTGGTGAAWNNYILESLSGMTEVDYPGEEPALTIVPGNQNDDIPYIFANVRGYYLNAYSLLKSKVA